ncbi:MAG TPA: hypothetical protein DEP72_02530 [Clostridiales bacterium]|nr:MAG: hypothetical protein A2Y18_06070 [Clostridiales bacterium GWD2_32_19]HCC07032.1 hypothetical protein [Clostridiales bacterium]
MKYCLRHPSKSKDFKFRPDESDVTNIANFFSLSGELPQVIIDKIINAYNPNENDFKEIEISLFEFCKHGTMNKKVLSEIDNAINAILKGNKNVY